jgi:hypothetical protein
VLDGHGGKTSLAVCGALSTQRLRLALAAGDCAGAGSGGRGQEGSTQQFCARGRGGGAVFGEGLAGIGAVDSSSGAIGNAVNRAIEELVPVIATAPADLARRSLWLERLWEAYTADQIPFIETLGDFWGELCASRELASV